MRQQACLGSEPWYGFWRGKELFFIWLVRNKSDYEQRGFLFCLIFHPADFHDYCLSDISLRRIRNQCSWYLTFFVILCNRFEIHTGCEIWIWSHNWIIPSSGSYALLIHDDRYFENCRMIVTHEWTLIPTTNVCFVSIWRSFLLEESLDQYRILSSIEICQMRIWQDNELCCPLCLDLALSILFVPPFSCRKEKVPTEGENFSIPSLYHPWLIRSIYMRSWTIHLRRTASVSLWPIHYCPISGSIWYCARSRSDVQTDRSHWILSFHFPFYRPCLPPFRPAQLALSHHIFSI